VGNKIKLSSVLNSEQLLPHLARGVIEERVRSAILEGRLPPGTAIRQQELATLYGVSRMPVREALRQLEAQSLLNVELHKGARHRQGPQLHPAIGKRNTTCRDRSS
jgi:DNA-binding FadR family transcriptional regulator